MVTRLKPQRVKSSNSPQVGQNLGYEDSNNFKWQNTGSGVGDMKYSDFEWNTLTGNAITIEDISNNITPSSNFTVSAGTVKPGIEYVLRVNTGNTPYTMTLGTGVTNPNSYKTELKPNTVNQFKFIATSTTQLELEGVDSAVLSEINWGEIDGTLSNQTDLQNALDQKLDKVTSTATNPRAYVVNADGSQATLPITDSTTSGAIVRRNGTQITVPATPIANTDAASKKYVDDQVSAATAGAVSDTAYGTSWDGVTGIAPSKNAVYDKISAMDTTIAGKQNTLAEGIGISIDSNNVISNTGVTSVNGQTGAVTVLESQTKVFPMPEVGDDISDLVSWLSAGKVAVLADSQGHNYSISYWLGEEDEMNCIGYDQSSAKYVSIYIPYTTPGYIVDSVQIVNRGFVPNGGSNGQVLTQTNNGPTWQNPTGTEYNAGEGIEIKNGGDYSAMQGPCPTGFHVPLPSDWENVISAGISLGRWTATNGDGMSTDLKLPYAGELYFDDGQRRAGDVGQYWSCQPYSEPQGYALYASISPNVVSSQYECPRSTGCSVRPFKDNPVVPDSNWTAIYQGTGSAGIFHNATDGLISISSDGVTWYTIADKNLGATVVYNWGDALSESNCGGFFQWGNNYMFPFTGATTVSSTLVDASAYGPGNYYSSSTFISGTIGAWDSPENLNLWGYVTGATIYNNAITNTGVLVSDQPNNILQSGMKIWAGLETDYGNLGTYDSNCLYLTIE